MLLKSDYVRGRNNDERLFRFESYCLSKEEYEDLVVVSWHEQVGETMAARIEGCLNALASWAAESFGNIRKQIREVEKALKELQNQSPDASTINQCGVVSKKLDELHLLEESYWYICTC